MIDDPLMLDANAVAGDLDELFGFEMTAGPPLRPLRQRRRARHAAGLDDGPGIVLRCCICREVVIRGSPRPTAATASTCAAPPSCSPR